MKTYILSLVFALAALVSLSAQTEPPQPKQAPPAAGDIFDQIHREAQQKWPVEKCRAYAQMQMVLLKEGGSLDTLTVPELLAEADQMKTCGENDLLRAGATEHDALEIMQKQPDYLTIAARCHNEVISRLTWWVERKHLTDEFLQSDANARAKPH